MFESVAQPTHMRRWMWRKKEKDVERNRYTHGTRGLRWCNVMSYNNHVTHAIATWMVNINHIRKHSAETTYPLSSARAQQPLISISSLRLFVLRNRIERMNLMNQTIAVWKFRENFKYFVMTSASIHLQILDHFLRRRNVTQTKHWIHSLLSLPLFPVSLASLFYCDETWLV